MTRQIRFTFFGVALLAGCATVQAQISPPFVRATASARYQGDDGGTTSNQVNFPVVTLPGFTTAHVLVPVGGATGYGRPGRLTAFDDAEAFARSTMPGTVGAYARSGGYSPGHMNTNPGVISVGIAEKVANWRANAPGNFANVNLRVFLDGWLYTSTNSALSNLLEAKVSVSVTLETLAGITTVFSVSGTHNNETGFSQTFSTSAGSSDAVWASSWTDTSATLDNRNGRDYMWDLNYQEVFPGLIQIPLNETFATRVTMTAEALNNEGPYELFATSDFSNSADIDLTTDDPNIDLQMVNLTVPEPSSLIALVIGMAACCTALRRRR